MSDQPKKMIPKFKKQLKGFLLDESGKITKEDVLKMGMLAMGVAAMTGGTPSVSASHTSSCSLVGTSDGTVGTIVSNPWSRTVNGHANAIVGSVGIQGLPGHSNGQGASHSSIHANSGSGSGSGGWC